jgi:polyisoprenoid-binding protein YceI
MGFKRSLTMIKSLAVAAAVLAALPAFAADYVLDPSHSTAQFGVTHMMVSTVRGQFEKVSGTATIDEKDASKSKVNVTIDAKSINTREPKRDTHLRSPDFFDVEKYPNLTFTSSKVEKKGEKYVITGDLTMHGITRPVTLDAQLTAPRKSPFDGKPVIGVSASGKLSRKEWGLTWNKTLETGGMLVSDEVQLVIDAELREAPKAVN